MYLISIQNSCFKNFHLRARGRHENVNGFFKKANALSTPFRLDLPYHPGCFHAIARLAQIMLENDQRF